MVECKRLSLCRFMCSWYAPLRSILFLRSCVCSDSKRVAIISTDALGYLRSLVSSSYVYYPPPLPSSLPGNLILLNLFLAIMLSSFDGEAMKEAGNEKAEAELELKKKQEQEEKAASKLKNTLERNKEKIPGLAKFFATQRRIKEEEEAKQKALQDAAQTKVQRCTSIVLTNRSLWVLPPQQQPRKFVTSIVTAPWFDNFILFLILVSSVNLAIDNPLDDPDMPKSIYLKYMDVIMTWCFVLEMILKIISMGFILRPFPHAYLHTGWNILDFVIVIISILGIVPFLSGQEGQGNDPFSSLRSLRTLRALRPLRMISRAPGLRLIVNALLASIPPIINILLICVLFFMIFGIVAISYFKVRRARACSLSLSLFAYLQDTARFSEYTIE